MPSVLLYMVAVFGVEIFLRNVIFSHKQRVESISSGFPDSYIHDCGLTVIFDRQFPLFG